jgi:hypothetical protein
MLVDSNRIAFSNAQIGVHMFKTIGIALCTAAIFAAGVQAQEVKTIPDLKGKWESTSQMHFKKHGHQKSDKNAQLVVLSQEGRVFHGTVGWSTKSSPGKDTFSGVIEKDGVTFYAAGHSDGLRIGKMDGPDAFTLYIVVPGGANPRAGFAEFKRVK